jgi:hypothetical protein
MSEAARLLLTLAKSPVDVGDAPAGYWVQARNPETTETTEESFAHIRDAIARATELVRSGYSVRWKGTR